MLRSIADWNQPPSDLNVKLFANPTDLFDPRQHVIPNSVTDLQWHNYLKTIWHIDNICEHWDLFFGRNIFGYNPHRLEMLQRIPSDLLWCLHYVFFFGTDPNNRIKYTWSWPASAEYSNPYISGANFFEYQCTYEPGKRSEYSFRTENWDQELHAKLREVRDKVEQHLARFGQYFRYHYCNPEYQNSLLNRRMSDFTCNVPYCAHDGDAYTRSQVLQYLNAHTDAQYIQTDNSLHFAIRIAVSKANKSALFRVFNYSTSPLTMLNWPLKAKGEYDPILYGVELEFSSDYSAQNLVEASDEPFFILKSDSSVSGNKRNMYELVTIPMSFKAHKKQWAYWFSNLDYSRFDTTKDTNNGMHVHISPEAWVDQKHQQDFAWFFTQPAHHEFMQCLSERTADSMRHYTAMPQHSDRHSRVQVYNRNEDACKSVRGCINFSNKGTLEVRLFRGIVSLADVLKNLEFIDSVLHFTMDRKILTKLTLDNYFKWLQQQPRNKYAILKKYFDTNTKLIPHIRAAKILDLIFTESNPQKIIEIIQKSKLQVTNEHVTILNRKWKKRIFILDKSTGQIKLSEHNKSAVSFLDRLVEAKILGKHKKGTVLSVTQLPQPEEPDPEEPYEEEEVIQIPEQPAPARDTFDRAVYADLMRVG